MKTRIKKQPIVFRWLRAAVIAGLYLQLGATSAMAAGYAVPEGSALGTATANAVVANPEETGAFIYNPAAMGFHDQTSVSLGALFISRASTSTRPRDTTRAMGPTG